MFAGKPVPVRLLFCYFSISTHQNGDDEGLISVLSIGLTQSKVS